MEEEIVEQVTEQPPPRPVGTFYLKFEDEAAFLAACEEAGLTWEEPVEWETVTETVISINELGEEETKEVEKKNPIKWTKHVIFHSHHHVLAPLPVLLRGEEYSFNEETGEVIVVKGPEIIPGYHANYSGVLPESFESAVLDPAPATPYMTFG